MRRVKRLVSQINYIFDGKQKVELILLMGVILLTTVLELLGVTAIMPLIEVIMNPDTVFTTPYLNFFYQLLSFKNTTAFLIFLSLSLIIIYWIKNACIIFSYNTQYKFTFSNQKKLASKMLECYLKQPYFFHLSHNSSELIRSINTDIVMMFQGILSLIQLIAELTICIILGTYLFIKDAEITIILLVFLCGFVVFFAKKFKTYLQEIGEEDRKYSANIVKWLQQSFGGLKETKIMHREPFFLRMFEHNYNSWANLEQIYRNLQIIPKPVMESLCMTAIMLAIVIKLFRGVDSVYFISTISAFAVAAFRLMPSFNRISGYISVLLFNYPAFEAVYEDLKRIEDISEGMTVKEDDHTILELKDKIDIRNLSYKYPSGEDFVLKNINVEIPKNKSIALIGPSGAGKTTLADLILGALEPTEGGIYIDSTNAFEHLPAWQKNVGYIPQSIYLMDDTIRNNIIYGADEIVDDSRLMQAVEEAQLKEFIDTLSDGLDTEIGERGVRLSGGQRQRIGIARALYTNPQVLVLDEATSALDNDTEKAVMEAIDSLAGSKTLIIIAHRLSTVENCDIKYEVKDGNVFRVK